MEKREKAKGQKGNSTPQPVSLNNAGKFSCNAAISFTRSMFQPPKEKNLASGISQEKRISEVSNISSFLSLFVLREFDLLCLGYIQEIGYTLYMCLGVCMCGCLSVRLYWCAHAYYVDAGKWAMPSSSLSPNDGVSKNTTETLPPDIYRWKAVEPVLVGKPHSETINAVASSKQQQPASSRNEASKEKQKKRKKRSIQRGSQ